MKVVSLTLPAAQLEECVNRHIAKLKQRVSIAGFRPGKVPPDIIRRQYGETLLNEVGSDLMRSSFLKTAVEKDIKLAGVRAMKPKQLAFGKDFVFEVSYEVFPNIEIEEPSKSSVEIITAGVKEQDVETMIENMREGRAELIETDTTVSADSVVLVDYEMEVPSEAAKTKKENQNIDLSAQLPSPHIGASLIGKKKGEEVFVKDKLPLETEKGEKDVMLRMTIKKVQRKELPPLDESFFLQYGVRGTENDFRAQIRKNMEFELSARLKNISKERVYEAILAPHQNLKVPETQIAFEARQIRDEIVQQITKQTKKTPREDELPLDMFRPQAERKVKASLLLLELVKKNDIKVDDALVQRKIAALAAVYREPARVIKYYNKNEKLLEQLKNSLLEEKAIEHFLSQVMISKKELSYKEVMEMTDRKPDVR